MKKIENTKIMIIALSVIIVVLLGVILITTSNSKPQEPIKKYSQSINFQGVHYLGDLDAPVKITEYSSITCPFCKRYFLEDGTFENIKTEYIDTGKVLYAYKHFPRNQIDVLGAVAMECAGEQEMFFEYKEIVYKNQANLQNQEFEKYAQELNLNINEFNSCYEKQGSLEKINKDKEEAINNGITGTPGFLINQTVVSGAQPFSVFKQIIDSELL